MKNLLRQADAAMRTGVERVRTWFDPPLTADAKPLEIRAAIIGDVEQRVEPAGGGRRVLPYNHVVVTLLAAEKDDRVRLQAALSGLKDAIGTRLNEIRCSTPAGLEVDVQYVKKPQPEWTAHQRLAVAYDVRKTADPVPDNHDPRPLTITVLRGVASAPAYTLAELRVLVGRTATPVDNRGRPRKNHVVFLEEGDEHSRTVGRAHASIRWDADRREYRIFDDGSHNGTRIVRRHGTVDVTARDPVGVAIASGDEIEFGTAAIKVEF